MRHAKARRAARIATLLLAPAVGLGCSPGEREALQQQAEEAASEVGAAVEEGAEGIGVLTEGARRQAREEILELEREWSRRFGAGDVEWIVARHAEDGRLMPPNAEAAVGREAIRQAWAGMATTEGLALSWEPTEARVSSSGDMAYDIGTYTMTTPDGRTDTGKYVVVWVKQNGEWKIAADIFNSNRPPAGV